MKTSHILMAALLSLAALPAAGIKADPRPKTVTLPDGSSVTLRLTGDEYAHHFLTPEGYPAERGADGFFYLIGTDGVATNIRVATSEAETFMAATSQTAVAEAITNREAHKGTRLRSRVSSPRKASYPTLGDGRGIVVLVEYQDLGFRSPDPKADFERMLNMPGYSENGATGSAADWFSDNSMGRFTPVFDVYGPIKLAHDMAYYGSNNSQGDDINAHFMAIEACQQLDPEVDFTIYDRDGDGFIDNVYIFYAGYGENLGGNAPAESVWPHSWDILEATNLPYMFDNVRLNHYACSNELSLDDTMDGIGTFCHEFSHVLGLPDLYATNYSYAFTPGEWSVMDGGSYNNNNRTPPYYTAYERLALGWLDPRELKGPADVKLGHVAANTACIIRTSNENEYFLFENRQQTGWDRYIPYHGMLIWHIDYNENVWKFNTVNNSAGHQYVDIEEADNLPYSSSLDGDPFPGTANVTSFTDDTTPGMLSWSGERQEKPITDIRESNGYIYFKVCGGKEETSPVTANPASEVGIDSFTASWSEGDYGCDYLLSVFTTDETEDGKPILRYVEGYDNLNVGETTEHKVAGLEPATHYSYVVIAYDRDNGRASIASNQIDVTTLPPTFDYLRPEFDEATDITSDSFTISWSVLENADTYLLEVYTKEYGEAETETIDFTGGISSLPNGWFTPSSFTYGAVDYAGESAPSLRLNSAASYICSRVYSDGVRSLSFWHRGVGCSEEDRIVISTAGPDGTWRQAATVEISNSPEGATTEFREIAEHPAWPGYFTALRIGLETAGKGAVAIDDIAIEFGGDFEKEYVVTPGGMDTEGQTSLEVTGLQPETAYWASVTAVSGGIFSRISLEKRIITLAATEDSGVASPSTSGKLMAVADGNFIDVKGIQGSEVWLYAIDGSMAASGKAFEGECRLCAPSPGLFIITDGNSFVKVLCNQKQ